MKRDRAVFRRRRRRPRRRARWSFPDLFDPRGAPWIFLLGAVVLTLLGNGLYSFLVALLGDRWQTHALAIMAALSVFGLVIRPQIASWLRRRGDDDQRVVAKDQEAEPHAGLILLMGPSPSTTEALSVEWHLRGDTLRHCWIVADPAVRESHKYRDLAFRLVERNVQVHWLRVDEASQVRQSFAAVKLGIEQASEARGGLPVIVDFTAGLKTMTAGAVLAAQQHGVTMQYLVAPRDPRTGDVVGSAVAMKVELRDGSGEASNGNSA